MKVGIIGGGITGLTAGYRLAKAGHQVTIFEKEDYLGGLASGFKEKNWQWCLEHFFHHFFASDQAAKNLIKELGLAKKLIYTQPKTSVFINGKISQFDSPLSVLSFPYLSLAERLRIGLVTLNLKLTNDWQKFEMITAQDWLSRFYGEKVYQLLWQPLLRAKFGPFANQISMAWFWARIKKRSRKLGYLRGGLPILFKKLAEKIRENQGRIFFNCEVKDLDEIYTKFDRIIITAPTPTFLKITGRMTKNYRARLEQLRFLGALNLILVIKEKFLSDGTYWLNINEKGYPFVAVVEHTNFVNSKYYSGSHILYVGGYYSQDHPYLKMKKKEIFREFLPYLKKINPKFNQLSASPLRGIPSECSYQLSANLYAQPVIPLYYSKMIPSMETPIKNLYIANQSLIYPWDRGVNYGIKLGEGVAKLLCKK